ncbi:uncharacterized protein RCC_00797 [Ramularia collo-cygni]|uniref:Uncharacterized protein n=1 Tax=Ramularia collo-cygni TaxID=112498 RepID=A0A2D3ULH0_9PEZI|nr:uncharacterized protein RCC_00797 [Ramularia collo-cygni]CZT14862.1 uncharacterized protein RCC_00797 [Ramularia collo-cygni]
MLCLGKRPGIAQQFKITTTTMSHPQPLSYSAALGQGASSSQPNTASRKEVQPSAPVSRQPEPVRPAKRSPSPSHVPRTSATEDDVFVLTLLTDRAHHDRMTALRKKYFPSKINKLAAHLTLFHALPGSKLESSILPTIKELAGQTAPFHVRAESPFRMKKGFAVSISEGGKQGGEIHRALQGPWKAEGFLSDQDAGGARLHYTLMNKVDDENAVSSAYQELVENWRGDGGMVEGLALWRYERGYWKWVRKFDFDHA